MGSIFIGAVIVVMIVAVLFVLGGGLFKALFKALIFGGLVYAFSKNGTTALVVGCAVAFFSIFI